MTCQIGPIGAGLGAAVGQIAAVVAEAPARPGRSCRPCDQVLGSSSSRGSAVQRVQHVEHRLVLQAVVLQQVISPAGLEGRRSTAGSSTARSAGGESSRAAGIDSR